jgi:hypothetical protein
MEAVVTYLQSQEQPASTLQVAKAVFGPSASCKQVNPLLYQLLKQGVATKTSESNGTNPRWAMAAPIGERNPTVSSVDALAPEEKAQLPSPAPISLSAQESVLLEAIQLKPGSTALQLARELTMEKGAVNSRLYTLKRMGQIRKGTEQPPAWYPAN